jgi:hypothetical protein
VDYVGYIPKPPNRSGKNSIELPKFSIAMQYYEHNPFCGFILDDFIKNGFALSACIFPVVARFVVLYQGPIIPAWTECFRRAPQGGFSEINRKGKVVFCLIIDRVVS